MSSLDCWVKTDFAIFQEIAALLETGRCTVPSDVKQYVPLEIAQEIERQKNTAENLKKIAYENRDGFIEANQRLLERIEATKKVLDSFKPEWADHLEGEFGKEGEDLREWRNRLRDVLSKKTASRQIEKSCDKNCAKCSGIQRETCDIESRNGQEHKKQ